MGVIRIVMPPWNPCHIEGFAAMDMETEEELGRASPGETMVLPADAAMDLGIAWVRIGAPAVRLRFAAHPGRTYELCWLTRGFGAGMGVTETEQDCRA